jgi:serine phosphatase RsbU (regulator of sigma subunit)
MRFLSIFREDVPAGGRRWIPLALVLGSIVVVAYADHVAATVPLGYLYILPLGIGAMFLRSDISYFLTAVCIFLHDLFRPAFFSLPLRLAHNGIALIGFVFVVYVIQRYVKEKEILAKTMRTQRDELLKDVELAGHVQRMFLPIGRPSIAGLDIAGKMQPARTVGGDYYDYIPINDHSIQMVIADVAGKGVPAALLMSAAAAGVQLETGHVRDLAEVVGQLNTEIHSVSDGVRFVTLLLAEVDAQLRKLRYVNCGHNPGLLLREEADEIVPLNSSCPPLGFFADAACEISETDLRAGDVIVLYTDGLTEAENATGEEFGIERLSAILRRDSSLAAEEILDNIFRAAVDFQQGLGFADDVTILVVKCGFARTESFIPVGISGASSLHAPESSLVIKNEPPVAA